MTLQHGDILGDGRVVLGVERKASGKVKCSVSEDPRQTREAERVFIYTIFEDVGDHGTVLVCPDEHTLCAECMASFPITENFPYLTAFAELREMPCPELPTENL